MTRIRGLLKKRSISNIILDLVFVVWVSYFLITGNLIPPGLLASNPPTQATHIEDAAPPVIVPLDDDQATFDERDLRNA